MLDARLDGVVGSSEDARVGQDQWMELTMAARKAIRQALAQASGGGVVARAPREPVYVYGPESVA